ncbi:MAG: BatD family protein [Pseudomonadota bacterium]|nr:BatD family protein [Pseudomonadota bacterium]
MVNTFTSTILIALNKGQVVRSSISVMLLFMLFSASVSAAKIVVAVDRTPITITDSFQLTFSTTDSPDDDPNFAPLKQDFDILNQQKSSQLSWLNGSTKKTIRWTLSVMAKRSGNLQIPAISFGNDMSQPLSITVIETTPLNAISEYNELFLEVEASPTNAYVQAQVLYTVRLYQRINLAQATLSDPKLDNAVVEKLGEDHQYNTKLKGVSYLVTERKYAIFPQQSGVNTIAPLVLTADVITDDPRSRFNSFFSNQNTLTKRILSKEINLNLQATPAGFEGDHWLPAEQLALKETWSNDTLQVKVGEPITRTLTILAKGATSSQLPELSTQQVTQELKVYPDQAVINDQKSGDGIIAIREQKIAFIASTAGNFILPTINVPWFNTQTQEMEQAQLPAVTLVAIASEPANPSVKAPAIQSSQQPPEITPTPSAIAPSNIWFWATLGFGIAWMLTLLFIFWSRFNKPRIKIKSTMENTPVKLKEIIKELKIACAENNPQSAQQALIKWATFSYKITNLVELNTYCDAAFQAELTKLNQALYGKDKLAWDGSGLLQEVVAKQTKQSSSKSVDEPLVPLYPSQRQSINNRTDGGG